LKRLETLIGVLGLVLPLVILGGMVAMELLAVDIGRTSPHLGRFLPIYLMLAWGATNLFYAWHAYFSGRVPAKKRGLWVALLLLANYAVMPFYFWWYLRPAASTR
jgi:hypothetical protein